MSTVEDDGFTRITLRIPRELHAKLVDAAAKKRSTNAEIIARLEASFVDLPDLKASESTARLETLLPVLVEMIESYQKGEKPNYSIRRKKP